MLAVGLALLSSFLFALAATLQQMEAGSLDREQASSIKMLLVLVRRPRWLAGVAADAGGFITVAVALGVGRLVVVQPLVVTVLLFALPLSARFTGRRITRSDWMWATVMTVALAVMTVIGDATAGVDEAPTRSWLVAGLIGLVPIAASLVVGSRTIGATRALALGIAAGILFGYNDALIRTVTRQLDEGIWDVVTAWPVWALVVVLTVGTWLQQASYQAGALQASLPVVTGLEPLAGMLLGLTIFEERFQASGPIEIGLLVLSFAAAGLAVYQLARSEGRRQQELDVPVPPDAGSAGPGPGTLPRRAG